MREAGAEGPCPLRPVRACSLRTRLPALASLVWSPPVQRRTGASGSFLQCPETWIAAPTFPPHSARRHELHAVGVQRRPPGQAAQGQPRPAAAAVRELPAGMRAGWLPACALPPYTRPGPLAEARAGGPPCSPRAPAPSLLPERTTCTVQRQLMLSLPFTGLRPPLPRLRSTLRASGAASRRRGSRCPGGSCALSVRCRLWLTRQGTGGRHAGLD